MLDRAPLHNATKRKYMAIFRLVQSMRIRQKRHLFYILRHAPNVNSDLFLPQFGLHCGEFACFQILSEHSRKEGKKETCATESTPASAETEQR